LIQCRLSLVLLYWLQGQNWLWENEQMNRHSFGLLAVVLAVCWYSPTLAEGPAAVPRHDAARSSQMSKIHRGGNLSLDEVVNRVRMRMNGRILSAEDIGAEYRIRVLTGKGKVRRLRIDPATGEIIR